MARFIPLPMMFSLLLFMMCCFYLGRAIDCGGNQVTNTITVDQQGKGAFTTIQAAIDSIKMPNNQWIMIKINPGIYKEKVSIPNGGSCIILKGSGSNYTTITYNDSFRNRGTAMSATFISSPPNVILSGITFENTFGYDGQAVAAAIYGDKTAIFECSFIGYQDTLFSSTGRQYFKNCYIQGEMDFIFGAGQSYFENSLINATQAKNKPPGFVTAQRRDGPNDPNGFVFTGGSLLGNGLVRLGRPWGPYSRVIYWETYLSSVVYPRGWDPWHLKKNELKNVVYAEVNCTGPGSNTKKRVKWVKEPNSLNLDEFTLSSFINKDGWIANIPSI